MRLSELEIKSGIKRVAINKLALELKTEGFSVYREFSISANIRADLYAEKDGDRRIYEFRFGIYKIREQRYSKLQELAGLLNARLLLIYLNMPTSNNLEFDELVNILKNDLYNNIPGDLDVLSPHTVVEYVDDVEIDRAAIDGTMITVSGSACAQVYTQIGSDGDLREGLAIVGTHDIPFDYLITYDFKTSQITEREYHFDLDEYYRNQ